MIHSLRLGLIFTVFAVSSCTTTSQPLTNKDYKILESDPNFTRSTDLASYMSKFEPIPLPQAADLTRAAPFECEIAEEVKAPLLAPNSLTTVYLAITRTNGQQSRCTGTFMKENVIATAGHCFFPEGPSKISSVLIAPGLYNNQAGTLVQNGIGSAFSYSIWYNGKLKIEKPPTIAKEESKEDYTFLILSDDSLWRSLGIANLPVFVTPEFPSPPGIGGGEPVGKKYEYIGYPAVDDRALPLWRYNPNFILKDSPFTVTINQKAIGGMSGGALREAGTDRVAGIISAGRDTICVGRYVSPHEEFLKMFRNVSTVAGCIAASQSKCEKGCCSRLVPPYPAGAITDCTSNCNIP